MQGKLPSTLYVFSSDRSEVDSFQNLKNQGAVAAALSIAKIPFSLCEGMFEGKTEVSFCAYLPSNPGSIVFEEFEAEIVRLCKLYNQESYLQVSPEHTGRLVCLADDRIVPLGRASFLDVKPAAGNYTKFPSGSCLVVG